MSKTLFDCLNVLLIAPLLTCIIETPIIYSFKITKNIKYIIAVNLLTNYVLNLVGGVLYTKALTGYYVWVAVCEACVIPLSEAWLFSKISDKGKGKIIFASYVANVSSFLMGLLIEFILRRMV